MSLRVIWGCSNRDFAKDILQKLLFLRFPKGRWKTKLNEATDWSGVGYVKWFKTMI